MCGGQNYLLPAMDMAKVGGPLSVVNVFAQIWTSHVRLLIFFARASQRISYDFLIWKMGKWWFISQLWGRYVAYIRTPRVWANQNHHLLRYQKAQAVKIMKVTDKNYANGRRCKQWAPLISRHWCGFRYWIFVCHNSTSSKHRTFFSHSIDIDQLTTPVACSAT